MMQSTALNHVIIDIQHSHGSPEADMRHHLELLGLVGITILSGTLPCSSLSCRPREQAASTEQQESTSEIPPFQQSGLTTISTTLEEPSTAPADSAPQRTSSLSRTALLWLSLAAVWFVRRRLAKQGHPLFSNVELTVSSARTQQS
jgi:hypothetical protein